MTLLRLLRKAWRADDGSVAIEAGLSAPVIVLLLTGIGDFGAVLYAHHVVQTGVADAARHLSRLDDPVAGEPTAKRLAVTGSTLPGRAARLDYWTADQITVTYRTTQNPVDPLTGLRDQRGGDIVRVARVSTTITIPTLALQSVAGEDAFRFTIVREQRVIGE